MTQWIILVGGLTVGGAVLAAGRQTRSWDLIATGIVLVGIIAVATLVAWTAIAGNEP